MHVYSLTLEYTSKICKQAYPPGKHFTVPEWPDVEEVNRRGDFEIQSDRLAFIDGDRDPWRPMVRSSPLSIQNDIKLAYVLLDTSSGECAEEGFYHQ